MYLHHDRHLQTYVDQLNKLLKDFPVYQDFSLEALLTNVTFFPKAIQTPIRNNAGGVYNHIFYFSHLGNPSTGHPIDLLADMIQQQFGNFATFQKQFFDAALSVFGSGYAWLVIDHAQVLHIITTQNQDTPIPLHVCPILNLDVWEHAYYLKHYNIRADYIKDWFSVINWDVANKTLLDCFAKIPRLPR